jgi:NAD(P) transhydrogenase subunit alpha
LAREGQFLNQDRWLKKCNLQRNPRRFAEVLPPRDHVRVADVIVRRQDDSELFQVPKEFRETMETHFNPQVLMASLYVFALAAFLGYQVISRVPPLLHTPLMSATNALSAISVVGALVMAGRHNDNPISTYLGFVAVISASINVIGGFLITDRMLKMFKKDIPKKSAENKDGHK